MGALMLEFVGMWSVCGLGYLVLFLFMEAVSAHVRGPEFTLWVRKHIADHEDSTPLRMLLMWLFIWPVILVLQMRAFWNKQCFIEWTINRRLAKEELRDKAVATAKRLRSKLLAATGNTQGALWMSPPQTDPEGAWAYLRATARGATLFCTHIVFVLPDRTVARRIGSPMQGEPPPMSPDGEVFEDLAEATLWCNEDSRWNELCEHGTAQQRHLYLRGIIA